MKIRKYIEKHKTALCIVFLILSLSLFLAMFVTPDTDYFWHIKAGEYMVSNHMILKNDVFSWSLYGKTWISHEWLFEVFCYLLKCFSQSYHLFIYCFLCLFGLFFILFYTNRNNYLKNIPFSLVWVVIALMIYPFIACRPHMISYLFLALAIWILKDLFYNEKSKKIYFLPILSVFWANFHGGSSNLGYLLATVFLMCGLFRFSFVKIEAKRLSRKQIFKYLQGILLSVIGLAFNPHGIKMVIYPYENMANSFMLKTISEWQSTNFNEISGYIYLLVAVFILFIFLFSKKKIQLLDFSLFGLFLIMGLKSVRFWPYLYIVMTYFVFDYIKKRKYDKGTYAGILMLSFVLLLVFGKYSFNLLSRDKKLVSDEIINVIKEENPKRLYNYYDYGGYLIYNDIQVFVDGRCDLYSPYNYKDYYNLSVLTGDYEAIISKYDFDYFLVPNTIRLHYYLEYNNNYKAISTTEEMSLYKKISN